MIKSALMAAVTPALLSAGASSFDATTIIENMITSAQTQIYAVLGIVAPVVGSICVAITLVKFGRKWITQLAKG